MRDSEKLLEIKQARHELLQPPKKHTMSVDNTVAPSPFSVMPSRVFADQRIQNAHTSAGYVVLSCKQILRDSLHEPTYYWQSIGNIETSSQPANETTGEVWVHQKDIQREPTPKER